MRPALLLASAFFTASVALAQQITNVTVTPNPVHECEQFTFHIMGTAPPGMSFTFVNNNITGNSITLGIEASGPASGSSSFNNPLGPYGPLNAGTYALSIGLQYNGVATPAWTGSLTVLPADPPNIGEYTAISICNNAAPFSLLSRLDGSPDPGGVWLDPQLNVVVGGQFIPGTSPLGDYLYYFPVPPPCVPDYQSLSITYLPNSSAGANSAVSLCTVAGLAPVDLFGLLGGTPDAGGTWTGPNTTGIFTPGVSPAGQYVYHVPGIAPCPDPAATVTVTGIPASNPGTGDSAVYCFDETAADLFNHISGADGSGVWYGPDFSPIGFFQQVVDVSYYGPGNYAYIVTAAPCPADTAYVPVTLDGPPCTLGIQARQGSPDGLHVMPNPASREVMVEVQRAHPASGQFMELCDVSGKVVLHEKLDAVSGSVQRRLDLSGLAPGAYVLKLAGGAGSTATQRLMVE